MKVAALGRTHWLRDTIEAVAARGHEIVLIGTSAPSPEYRAGPEDFKKLASAHGCPFFQSPRLDDPAVERSLRACRADVAVSVNWTSLIPAALLDIFPHGMLNAHAGALPRYRGNAAPNWAILQGEREVGLTIHRISAELDSGPILLQEPFPLTDETYIGDVYAFLEKAIPRMFVEALDGLADGSIVPRPQSTDPADALRGLPRRAEDGLIDWSQPAERIARLVRASAEPFAGAYAFLDGERLTIWRARRGVLPLVHLGIPGQVVARRPADGEVDVLCGDGLLIVETVESAAEGRRPAADVIRSTRAPWFASGILSSREQTMPEPMTLEQIKIHWEEAGRRCGGDESVTPTSRDPYLAELERENVLAFLPAGCRMLEVGCGDGVHTIEYARACESVTAVDIAASLIDKVKGRLRAASVENVECVVASVLDLAEEVPASAFDCAVSQRCLINLPDWDLQQEALGAIHGALKPGGLLLLTEGFDEGLEELDAVRKAVGLTPLDVVSYNHMFRQADFEAFVRDGFEMVEVRDYGMYLLLSRVLHPLAVRPEAPKHDGRINEAALTLVRSTVIAGAARYSYNLFYALRKRD